MITNVSQCSKYIESIGFDAWSYGYGYGYNYIRLHSKRNKFAILINYNSETHFWFYVYDENKDIVAYYSNEYSGKKNEKYVEIFNVEDLVYFI